MKVACTNSLVFNLVKTFIKAPSVSFFGYLYHKDGIVMLQYYEENYCWQLSERIFKISCTMFKCWSKMIINTTPRANCVAGLDIQHGVRSGMETEPFLSTEYEITLAHSQNISQTWWMKMKFWFAWHTNLEVAQDEIVCLPKDEMETVDRMCTGVTKAWKTYGKVIMLTLNNNG